MKQEQGNMWQGCRQFFSSCSVQGGPGISSPAGDGDEHSSSAVLPTKSITLAGLCIAGHWLCTFFFLGEYSILKAVYCSWGDNSSGNHLISLPVFSPCILELFQWQCSLLLLPWWSSSYCSGDLEDHFVYAIENNAATLLPQAPYECLW